VRPHARLSGRHHSEAQSSPAEERVAAERGRSSPLPACYRNPARGEAQPGLVGRAASAHRHREWGARSAPTEASRHARQPPPRATGDGVVGERRCGAARRRHERFLEQIVASGEELCSCPADHRYHGRCVECVMLRGGTPTTCRSAFRAWSAGRARAVGVGDHGRADGRRVTRCARSAMQQTPLSALRTWLDRAVVLYTGEYRILIVYLQCPAFMHRDQNQYKPGI